MHGIPGKVGRKKSLYTFFFQEESTREINSVFYVDLEHKYVCVLVSRRTIIGFKPEKKRHRK